ncbi:TonB-dependent receptor [Zhongshania sp.]|uniref:TonB-dependent receptor n=1 Tax=Zhongshania sp. TaxID=1971902 RepID=UPI0035686916
MKKRVILPALLSTLGSQFAVAQTNSDDAAAKAAPRVKLEEVLVTATKREVNLRELTSTVNAIGGDDLESGGFQGQEDFLKLLPGVTFYNDGTNSSRITIRGIGADLNTSNTTGVFIGDVPFEDPVLPRVTLDPNPFDLARIEVLKGPQGTLFGGSALNGAVRYVPQDPAMAEWQIKTYYQSEDVNEGGVGHSYGAAINIPLGEHFALRAMAFERESAGWVDSERQNQKDVNEIHQSGNRFMALWTPTDEWRISAMSVSQNTVIKDTAITDNREGRLSRSNTVEASPQHPRYNLQTLGIQYSFESFDVLSQTSKTRKSFDAFIDASRIGNIENAPPSVAIVNDNTSDSLSQELRFTSHGDSPWTWLAGAFYREINLHETIDVLASNTPLPLPPELLNSVGGFVPGFQGTITEEGKLNTAHSEADPIEVEEIALFGEVSRTFWGSLEATLGLRAFRNTSYSHVSFSGALSFNQTVATGSTESVEEGTLKEEGINPKFALKYIYNDNISIYGSVSKGFRFGGAQVLIGTFTSDAPPIYKSDTIWAYEIGLRTQWLDETLTVDITPFLVDWTDPQLQQADSSGIGAYFDNVGGAQARGAEMSINYLTPIPGLMLSFAGSYVDTVTTEPFIANNGAEIPPGTRWPLASQQQSVTTISYGTNLPANWSMNSSLTFATISSAPNTLAYLDEVFGYETLDAQLSLSNEYISGRPEIALTLSNALDERGRISGVNNPQFANDNVYIRPKTITARLSLSF